ncbi:MAG: DUF721 domain-containing protein [Alphaproteobacteria bacterium]|jgi:hypothetical protein|nr:DUF721 domain-containing protein [Candidatus Jidaibacter sp.]
MKRAYSQKFSSIFDDMAKSTFKKYGFANIKIMESWRHIVGERLSDICWPEKIAFANDDKTSGILHIAIANPSFALELQAMENVLIGKITTFLGYKAVSRIKIRIVMMPIKKNMPEKKVLAKKDPNPNIANVQDEELRMALESLYQNI